MYPFQEGDTYTTFRNLVDKIISEIRTLETDYILKASQVELEEHYIAKMIIQPLVLHSDQKYIRNQSGTKIDVSHDRSRISFSGKRPFVKGTKIEIAIPFEGDPLLWRIRASTFSLGGFPEIEIGRGEITFTTSFSDDNVNSDTLKSEINRAIDSLETAVKRLENDVINHNNSVQNVIKQALEGRLQRAKSTSGAISSLGIPIKRTITTPTFTIPTKRRELPTQLPKVDRKKYEPEPVLEEKEYRHILNILNSMALVIERNPASFASLDEETIRDHFLLQLNGHYEGGATGETFNASGKTDILIRVENKNVFIAECKFWKGKKGLIDAVSQLLGYLTWRDSKCALLVFNKTKDSDSVRLKMHETLEELPEHRKTVSRDPSGEGRYILVKESEPGKEIIITTQLYDIPKNIKAKG